MSRVDIARQGGSPAKPAFISRGRIHVLPEGNVFSLGRSSVYRSPRLRAAAIRPDAERTKPAWVYRSRGTVLETLSF